MLTAGLVPGHNELRCQVQGRDGAIVEDQFITENHALMMYEPMLSAGIPVRDS